jgi:intein/homing endonuclease
MNLLDFLTSKGVVRGNKILQQFDIPEWIKASPEYKKYFVRGLVDTDGCLYIHQHKVGGKLYKNLGLCFSSYSKITSLYSFNFRRIWNKTSYHKSGT